MSLPVYVVLDVASALATLAAVGFFVRVWTRSGAPLHLLLGVGFLLLAASYPFVASSELDPRERASAIDVARFLGQTGGALVLALAYAASHGGRAASPLHVLAWSVAFAALLLGGMLVVEGVRDGSPSKHEAAFVAHAVQAASFATCAALSASAYRRVPMIDRALVPAAFLLWALGKSAWLLIDAGGRVSMLPLAYVGRFAALALLILALTLPVRRPRARAPDGRVGGAA